MVRVRGRGRKRLNEQTTTTSSSSSPPPPLIRSSSHSRPLKRPADADGVWWHSVFILLKTEGRMYVRRLQIREDGGCVDGLYTETLPLVAEISHHRPIATLGCTALDSSKLVTLANDSEWDVHCAVFNVEDGSSCSQSIDPKALIRGSPFCQARLLIGASGMIYDLAVGTCGSTSNAYFQRFHPENSASKWESLPDPPFSGSLRGLHGYVVLANLILVCVSVPNVTKGWYRFWSFNTYTREWQTVPIAGNVKSTSSTNVNQKNLDWFDGIAYPICGKAEFVDGVIYSYTMRKIVSYRLTLRDGQAYLAPPVLTTHEFNGSCFEDAPGFQVAPFGFPTLDSGRLTYLGNNMFCAVETAEEEPDSTCSQAVYVTIFRLEGGKACILHSTTRFVLCQEGDTCCDIAFCLARSGTPRGSTRCSSVSLTVGSILFEHYMQRRIHDFCEVFIRRNCELMPIAVLLYTKLKGELVRSKDRIVKFFVEYMKYIREDGSPPDLLMLVEKNIDNRLLQMRKEFDSGRSLESSKSMFVACLCGYPCYVLYKLKIFEGGVIDGCKISPIKVLKESRYDAEFAHDGVACVGRSIYFVSEQMPNSICFIIKSIYAVNIETNESFPVKFKKPKPKPKPRPFGAAIIGCGSKVYALYHTSKETAYKFPAFECFDPVSNKWEVLENPPFHSMKMSKAVSGYAVAGDHILISLDNDECDFYSYNVCTKKWSQVSKLKKKNGQYSSFEGRADYVDGKIYAFSAGEVWEYSLLKSGEGWFLRPPILLKGLDAISLPVPWVGKRASCMTHLGDKLFCVVETGVCDLFPKLACACVTTFSLNDSGSIETCHSTICLLDTDVIDEVYASHGFSPI